MISFAGARNLVLQHAFARRVTDVALEQASGRVLARDVRARIDDPDFNRSVMDGFALRAGDVRRPGAVLKIVEFVPAGRLPRQKIGRGECSAIATGAMVPQGADAVVMKEETKFLGLRQVMVLAPVLRGQLIRRKGSDLRRGTLLLKRGAILNPARVGLLASQGFCRARVFGAPRVALLATGSEIVEPGTKRGPGQIWNASASMLASALASSGFTSISLGKSGDDPKVLAKKIAQGLSFDCLIITGGVSVGERDHVPSVLKDLGVRPVFHGVAVRPGKPLLFATRGHTLIFGLPGNPCSSLISFLVFVKPALLKMQGGPGELIFEEGVLDKDVYNESGRLTFFPGRIRLSERVPKISPLVCSGSADIRSAAAADIFFMLAAGTRKRAKNTKVKFLRIAP